MPNYLTQYRRTRNPGYVAGVEPASLIDYTDLAVFCEASQLSLNDGDAVSSFTDLTGNNNNFVQATGTNQPSFQTNEINGSPVVRGDGSNDYMTCPVTAQSVTTWMLFFVFRLTGAQSTVGIFQWADSLSDGLPYLLIQRENSTTLRVYMNGGYRFSFTVNDDTTYRLSILYDGSIWYGRLNGVTEQTYTGGGSEKTGDMYLFNGYNGYANMDVPAFLLYTSYNTGRRDIAEAYLEKYL